MNDRIQDLETNIGVNTMLLQDEKERVMALETRLKADRRALKCEYLAHYSIDEYARYRLSKRFLDWYEGTQEKRSSWYGMRGVIATVHDADKDGVTLAVSGVKLVVPIGKLELLDKVEE